MAKSWKEAKECAMQEKLPQVYHDCDDDLYGACNEGEQQGSFKGGVFYRAPLHLHARHPEPGST